MDRLSSSIASLSTVETSATLATSPKSPDDVVIVSALRTAICKAKKGGFKDTYPEELLAAVISETVKRTKIDPKLISDVICGSVLNEGSQRATEVRMGCFLAGLPEEVPVELVNRQCSSGIQAVAHAAANIKAGFYDVALACGVESMSLNPMKWEGKMNPRVFMVQKAKDCLIPMGFTSENVAARYNVSRSDQDAFAVQSHQRAADAQKSGRFKDEIVPVKTRLRDPKTGQEKEVVIDADDGIRGDTTLEGLTKLNPAFQKTGTTTAGNSSQVSDGAAAVLVMRRSTAEKLGYTPLATFITFVAAGCAPDVMGIGPAVAIPPAVKKAGLKLSDIDLFEINEAFASQALYSVRELGLDSAKVNVNGGAIALGHPLGATGARQVATLLNEMRRRKSRYGVISMCIGSGLCHPFG